MSFVQRSSTKLYIVFCFIPRFVFFKQDCSVDIGALDVDITSTSSAVKDILLQASSPISLVIEYKVTRDAIVLYMSKCVFVRVHVIYMALHVCR